MQYTYFDRIKLNYLVIMKEIVSVQHATIELWMHVGGC